jgi:mannose-1-phosphate guanylyltransferase
MDQPKQVDQSTRTAIILAGGDGTRLLELTRKITGSPIPKQFCPVTGNTTLLDQTRSRVSLTVPPDKTFLALTRTQDRFYTPLLADVPSENMVVQPENRGTLYAIVYSLLRVAAMYSLASVAIFPSDHFVDDSVEFMRHVELAFAAVDARPELTVLLGITPDNPEIGYGWIEPAQRLHIGSDPIFSVRRFWEKPSCAVARDLLARGCMWNSFVVVAHISTLLALTMTATPALYAQFAHIRASIGTSGEQSTLRALYGRSPTASFSEQVLARSASSLAVLPVRGVQWSDLGEPHRAMKTLTELGVSPQWASP